MWRFSKSSGPGGQHVNTTDSQVELRFDLAGTDALPQVWKDRALARLADRLVDGIVTVRSSDHRSQWRNRETAAVRLTALLAEATAPPPKPANRPASRAGSTNGGCGRRRRARRRRRGVRDAAGREGPGGREAAVAVRRPDRGRRAVCGGSFAARDRKSSARGRRGRHDLHGIGASTASEPPLRRDPRRREPAILRAGRRARRAPPIPAAGTARGST